MKAITSFLKAYVRLIGWMVLFSLLVINTTYTQQMRKISGILRDNGGNPLPGASIVIKGTNTGTTSDLNGYYQLEAPVGSTLQVSFVGYGTREIYVAPEKSGVDTSSLTKRKEKPAPHPKSDTTVTKPAKIYRHTIPESGDKTLSPYFFVKSDNPNVDRMPLKSTSADVSIAGVIADVTVRQCYVNEGKHTLEAIYIFPGSTRAAVYAMSMRIGQRVLKARIKERKQARADYEAAKAQGKTATLLEQNRPNVFQMNVTNILPGDTIEVELHYTEMIESTEGIYQFVYPTVVGPRYSETQDTPQNKNEQWLENPYLHEGEQPTYSFDLHVHLHTGIPVKKLYSPSHKVIINYEDKDKAEVKLDPSDKFAGNRDFILDYSLRGGKVESGLLLSKVSGENFFLLMMEPPARPTPDEIPPREYIFIVDVSGSMSGFPLDISKSVMRALISNLNPQDKFNILTFSGYSNLIWNKSQPATKGNINEAIRKMNNQTGGGGTRLLDALHKALSIPSEPGYSRTFVVITDGYVDCEKKSFELVRDNLNKANLFALGIGSSVNRYLIEGLAYVGMGEPYIATNPSEGEKIGKELISYIQNPVLTNISVDYGKLDVYGVEPVSIPDVFARRPIIVYGKYKGNDTTGYIRVNGISGDYHFSKSFALKNASRNGNQALRYLWARNRIRYLSDYAQYFISPHDNLTNKQYVEEQTAPEVTRLGLKYNLLTQYTSFIAVDSIARDKTHESVTVKQPLPLPKGVSDMAVGAPQRTVATSSVTGNTAGLSLNPDLTALQEIVVVGYGTTKKTDLTGAVSSISSNSLTINATTADQALKGSVAGVSVSSNSGAPGSASTVRIRGAGSLMGENEPLYVVDGVPLNSSDAPEGNTLLNINPSDIESIQVVKDVTAATVYGSRAANGVILIQTKKPEYGKQKITLQTGSGISTVLHSGKNADQAWYSNLIQHGMNNTIYVDLQKRSDKLQYKASTGFDNEKGVLEHSGLKRYTASAAISGNMFKNNLKIGIEGMTGFSVLNDYVPVNDTSNSYIPFRLQHTINNYYGKSFADITLPVSGLEFKNTLTMAQKNTVAVFKENPAGMSIISPVTDKTGLTDVNLYSGLHYQLNRDLHELTTLIRYEWWNHKNDYQVNTGLGELSDTSSLKPFTDNYTVNALMTRINYVYNDRYVANINLRYESNNRFQGTGNNILLPAISFAWNINNENFMSHLRMINLLKLRYSFGISANSSLPFSPQTGLITIMGLQSDYPFILENPALKWEKTHRNNFGIDAGFFHNRIKLSVDAFRNKTSNMYYLARLNPVNNWYYWVNAGNFRNRGIDIDLGSTLIERGSFTLKADMNIAGNRTKLTRVNETITGVDREIIHGVYSGQVLKAGDPLGVYYGYRVASIDRQQQRINYMDINGDGVIDGQDQTIIANTNPKYYGGAGLYTTCRNISLYVHFRWNVGNQVINTNRIREISGNYRSNLPDGNTHSLCDYAVEQGSYLKVQEITLGYRLPDRLTRAIKLNTLKISLTGSNLFTFTRYSGQDPEFNNWYYQDLAAVNLLPGVDRNYYPMSGSISLKLMAKF